jgi:hypothetical protein
MGDIMTVTVTKNRGRKLTRETLEERRERVEREAEQGLSKEASADLLKALFAKPCEKKDAE